MQEETAQELAGADGHHPLLVTPAIVLPSERDFAVLESDQSVVGDRQPDGYTGPSTAGHVRFRRMAVLRIRPSSAGKAVAGNDGTTLDRRDF